MDNDDLRYTSLRTLPPFFLCIFIDPDPHAANTASRRPATIFVCLYFTPRPFNVPNSQLPGLLDSRLDRHGLSELVSERFTLPSLPHRTTWFPGATSVIRIGMTHSSELRTSVDTSPLARRSHAGTSKTYRCAPSPAIEDLDDGLSFPSLPNPTFYASCFSALHLASFRRVLCSTAPICLPFFDAFVWLCFRQHSLVFIPYPDVVDTAAIRSNQQAIKESNPTGVQHPSIVRPRTTNSSSLLRRRLPPDLSLSLSLDPGPTRQHRRSLRSLPFSILSLRPRTRSHTPPFQPRRLC